MKRKKCICGNCVYYNGKHTCYRRRGGAYFNAPALCPDFRPKLEEQKMPYGLPPWMKLLQYNWKLIDLREEQKMNYFMLDGEKIPMSDETAVSLRKNQKTYKIGDCFKIGDYDTIVRLVQCGYNEVIAVCINDEYACWAEKQQIKNMSKITPIELRALLDRDKYTPVTVKVEVVK